MIRPLGSQPRGFLFLIKIVGGKMMDYILEILPALVSGAGMTLKVFFFYAPWLDSTGDHHCLYFTKFV